METKIKTKSTAAHGDLPTGQAGKKYIRAIGRRKTATAVVKIYQDGTNTFTINGKKSSEYFPTAELQKVIHDPVTKTKNTAIY